MVVEYIGQALRNSIADHKEKVYEGGAFAGQGGLARFAFQALGAFGLTGVNEIHVELGHAVDPVQRSETATIPSSVRPRQAPG